MKKICQICLRLAVIMLLMTIAFSSVAANASDSNTTDFVLVVDCSGTMGGNDPYSLCAEACEMFLDMIPEEDTRVSIVALGYKDDTQYEFSNYEVKYDGGFIHMLTPLQNISDKEVKASAKQSLNTTYEKYKDAVKGTMTPIGQALLAAVDLLETQESEDGQSAVILLSDGVCQPTNVSAGVEAIETAITRAAIHDWPVYTIQLDFDGDGNTANPYIGGTATKLMTRLATETGAGEEGHRTVTSTEDVGEAFLNIFGRFYPGGEITEGEFEIPELVSEEIVAVIGSDIDSVTLENLQNGDTITVTGAVRQNNLIVTAGNDYLVIKMICPDAGKWKVTAVGSDSADFVTYHNSIQELSLTMIATPSSGEDALTKNDTISCETYFSYSGNEVHQSDYYLNSSAALVVKDKSTERTKEFTMESTENGYNITLDVADIGSGDFELYTLLESPMFRSGQKVSNKVEFSVENLQSELTGDDTIFLYGHVNGEFDQIDLTKYITNPDGDEISYELTCTSDRNVSFPITYSNGYMTVSCGMVPGVFLCELVATETGSSDVLVVPMSLTVSDNPVEISKLPNIELLMNETESQNDDVQPSVDLDAAEYATDPDGIPVSVVRVSFESGKKGGELDIRQNGTVLTLTPVSAGRGELTVTVTDGFGEYEEVFKVEMMNGKTAFLRENFWWMLTAALAILVVLIVAAVLVSNKRIKGLWSIEIEIDGSRMNEARNIDFTAINNTNKAKCTLKGLLDSLKPFMTGNISDREIDEFYQVDNFEKIELGGVLVGHGCTVSNIPQGDNVEVLHNGKKLEKRTAIHGGNLSFKVKDDFENELSVTMTVI